MGDILTLKFHDGTRFTLQHSHDGHQRGGFSCAVAANQSYDFALLHIQVDSLQRVDMTVGCFQIFNFQHRPRHLPFQDMLRLQPDSC